ncbi:MAG: hydrogenase expression/formation protein HypE [Spirochaetota bacterium]
MREERIILSHGGGGRLMHQLIKKEIVPVLNNPSLAGLDDAARIPLEPGSEAAMVMTTDSFVVKPLFFPGGDIGKLAVCGTVNDLATAGAVPCALAAGFIIEEGFPISSLQKILRSMKNTADEVPVPVITGDTKVVERGRGEGIYISTTGVGSVPAGVGLSPKNIMPGDLVVINGPIGSHEASVLCARGEFSLGVDITSDCAPLSALMQKVLEVAPDARCARDPTRGGVASVLTELVELSGCGIVLEEEQIPVQDTVREVCEILGMDPLIMANEGKMLVVVSREKAEACVEAMNSIPHGKGSRIIGKVTAGPARLSLNTAYGTTRVVTMPMGDQLPRIC